MSSIPQSHFQTTQSCDSYCIHRAVKSLLLVIPEHSDQAPKTLWVLAGTPHSLEALQPRTGLTGLSVDWLAWRCSLEPSLAKSGLGVCFLLLGEEFSRFLCAMACGITSFLSIFHLPIHHMMDTSVSMVMAITRHAILRIKHGLCVSICFQFSWIHMQPRVERPGQITAVFSFVRGCQTPSHIHLHVLPPH